MTEKSHRPQPQVWTEALRQTSYHSQQKHIFSSLLFRPSWAQRELFFSHLQNVVQGLRPEGLARAEQSVTRFLHFVQLPSRSLSVSPQRPLQGFAALFELFSPVLESANISVEQEERSDCAVLEQHIVSLYFCFQGAFLFFFLSCSWTTVLQTVLISRP